MTAQRILPTAHEAVTAAIDELVAHRPLAVRHIEQGRYGDVVHGWLGQVRVMRAALAQLVAKRFVSTATDAALRDLARSDEFGAVIPEGGSFAFGRLKLRRSVTTESASHTFTRGSIPAGSRFRIKANRQFRPAIRESIVETTKLVPVNPATWTAEAVVSDGGEFTHAHALWVPVRAINEGVSNNVPLFDGEVPTTGDPEGQLFDRFTAVDVQLAGGGAGITDKTVRRAAKAAYLGRHGPTDRALVVGAFGAGLGVERLTLVPDTVNGIQQIMLADDSWGANEQWCSEVLRALEDWRGFGCRLTALPVINRRVHIEAVVRLKEAKFAEDRDQLTTTIQEAIYDYFDEREDFWVFRANALAAAIAAADRFRIKSVPTLPAILDQDGVVIAEPDSTPASPEDVLHYFVDEIALTFQLPNGTVL